MHNFEEAILFFRRCSSLESLEKLHDHKLDKAKTFNEVSIVMSAADHRRAELVNKRLFDPGKVPSWAWAYVS